MKRYRVELAVEAVQFTGDFDVIRGALAAGWGPHLPDVHLWANPDGTLVIPIDRRNLLVEPGDWIVRNAQGCYWICPDDIFRTIYRDELAA